MKYLKTIAAAALLLSVQAFAQYDMGMPMPMDPDLKIGKLDNGLTYFIQHNEEPKNRADFYIIYSVGALQEEENQNGLAHFLEHMAFNGSENFPGGNESPTSIVKTLERHGIAFGRNINAYTAVDRTVYHLDDIISTDEALVDTCLLVLHDWCHYLTLDPEEIDGERGVISEEWRTRNNSAARMRSQWYPIVFGDTRYTTHDIIGSYDIINNFKYDELRDFYYQWYRTDLQAVAVVGDIDPDAIEAKIRKIFSHIPAVGNPTPKEKIILPEFDEPVYALATDPEYTLNSVEIMSPFAEGHVRTVGDQRRRVLESIYKAALQQRFAGIVSGGDPALIAGSAGISDFIEGYRAFTISSSSQPGKDLEGFEKTYREVVRAKRFGFTEVEFERIKKDLTAELDKVYNQRNNTKNGTIADRIVSVFAYGKIQTNQEFFHPMMQFLIKDITLKELNDFAAALPIMENARIVVMAKEEEGYDYPTRDEILGVIARIDADKTITAYEEKEISGELIDKELPGGRIVKEKKLPVFGAKRWTLSNGATVVYAKADFDKDEISLTSNSYGGNSLYSPEMLVPAYLIAQAQGSCGLGRFTASEMKKVLAGKKASISLGMKDERESVNGTSSVADFETMMQMVWLTFEEPRFDSLQFKIGNDKLATILNMLLATPDMAAQDTLTRITTSYSPRTFALTAADIRAAKISDIERIYRERYSNASDYTFFIVGNIDEDRVRDAVETYLGSISSTGKKEKFIDHHEHMPKGHTVRNIVIPFSTPKANVNLVYESPWRISRKDLLEMTVLREVLNLRFVSEIREKEGGTYGVQSKVTGKRLPTNKFTYSISFDTDMDKAEHLRDKVLELIGSICNEGITEDEFQNVRKNILKEREQSKSKNKFVVDNLTDYVLYGEDNASPKNYEDILDRLSASDIRKFARKFFGKSDLVDVIFANEFKN